MVPIGAGLSGIQCASWFSHRPGEPEEASWSVIKVECTRTALAAVAFLPDSSAPLPNMATDQSVCRTSVRTMGLMDWTQART